jgi:uncharacterized protein (TIGR02231 family)
MSTHAAPAEMSPPSQVASSFRVKVTVFEDRAEVTRSATVTLPAGPSAITFPGLSPLIDEGRLVARYEAGDGAAGHIDDVTVARRIDTEAASVIAARRRKRAEQQAVLEAEQAPLNEAVAAAEAHRRDLEAILATATAARARRHGRGAVDVAAVAAELKDLEAALVDADNALRTARDAQQRALHESKALFAVPLDAGGRQRPVCDVTLWVSATAPSTVTVVLSTVVPCAAWRPSHEAKLMREADAAAGTVAFSGFGAVWNRTGEDWNNATLTLSTARPSQGAELPSLDVDRIMLRTKSAEERKTIHVEHRSEAVPKSATQGGAPGVDDGGEVRAFTVSGVSVPDDGRPHRVGLFSFSAPAKVALVAMPEKAEQVFVRASFRNSGTSPVLAGPVALSEVEVDAEGRVGDAAFIGTGDILYSGVGDEIDLAFGSDDGLRTSLVRDHIEDKKLIGKNIHHWRQRVTLTSTRRTPATVEIVLRLPVSELAQVKVIHSAAHSTVPEPRRDAHGLARIQQQVPAAADVVADVAFFFDVSGDVRLPDPW